jgi:uncharacterized protein YjbJ (UPF0337 family)
MKQKTNPPAQGDAMRTFCGRPGSVLMETALQLGEVKPKPAANYRPSATGSDDTMSEQSQQSMPSADSVAGKWRHQIGIAQIVWNKLTHDELLGSDGRAEKLTGLVQQHYAISRKSAYKQVARFIKEYKL